MKKIIKQNKAIPKNKNNSSSFSNMAKIFYNVVSMQDALTNAIKERNHKKALRLISQFAKINLKDSQGNYPLDVFFKHNFSSSIYYIQPITCTFNLNLVNQDKKITKTIKKTKFVDCRATYDLLMCLYNNGNYLCNNDTIKKIKEISCCIMYSINKKISYLEYCLYEDACNIVVAYIDEVLKQSSFIKNSKESQKQILSNKIFNSFIKKRSLEIFSLTKSMFLSGNSKVDPTFLNFHGCKIFLLKEITKSDYKYSKDSVKKIINDWYNNKIMDSLAKSNHMCNKFI